MSVQILKGERAQRRELLERIEALLAAKVLVYFLADSPISGARIGEDAPRVMYDHLRRLGHQKRLALYLYSIGGVMETPWKVVTMLREFCDELEVLVPYRAYSAATMIAIGCDKIRMTRKGELGPIDPAFQGIELPASGPKLPDLGVEDVASYLAFIRERAGLRDQSVLGQMVGKLVDALSPPLLGRVERTYSHIRLVANALLKLHRPPLGRRRIKRIAEALIEKIYVHKHGIGWRQARELGLDVELINDTLDDAVWSLFGKYEGPMRLDYSQDVESYFPAGSDDYSAPEMAVACIESAAGLSLFAGTLFARRIRRLPPNPSINVNLSLNLPPSITPAQLPQAVQQAVQQILQQGMQQVQQLIMQQLAQQSPVEGFQGGLRGGLWVSDFS